MPDTIDEFLHQLEGREAIDDDGRKYVIRDLTVRPTNGNYSDMRIFFSAHYEDEDRIEEKNLAEAALHTLLPYVKKTEPVADESEAYKPKPEISGSITPERVEEERHSRR
jgi:hypothetical protein